MEIISQNVKLSLEDKVKEGLTIEELELLIKNACDSFGLTPIDPSAKPNLELPEEVIANTSKIDSILAGYPRPYVHSRRFNLAGLNLGKIIEINGKKSGHELYIVATILAQLNRIPRDYNEMGVLDEYLAKEPRFKNVNLSKVSSQKGFILADYFNLIRDKPYHPDKLKLERVRIEKEPIYPTVKELHVFSPVGKAVFDAVTQGIISDEFKNIANIRLNKKYPGKILESLKLFILENKINNSLMDSFIPGIYTDIELKLRDDYYRPTQHKQTTLSL